MSREEEEEVDATKAATITLNAIYATLEYLVIFDVMNVYLSNNANP